MIEFLVGITIDRAGIDAALLPDLIASESRRAAELADAGTIVRLWRPADDDGRWRNLGLWRAPGREVLALALESLPLFPWMTIEVTELTAHPADPVRSKERESA